MRDTFFADKGLGIDKLTGVYEREVIVEYINYLISKGTPFSFAIGDIDNFKYVNDSYGHLTGDKVLKEVSIRFLNALGEDGVIGRYGGDEFLFVMPNLVEHEKVWQECRDIIMSTRNCKIDVAEDFAESVRISGKIFAQEAEDFARRIFDLSKGRVVVEAG